MRARIASPLLVVLGFFSSAHNGAAQSSPIPSQPRQETQERSPSGAKPLQPLPATQMVLVPRQIGSANDPAITPQELKTWIAMLHAHGEPSPLQRFGEGPDAPNCAHIQIIQAPEMDSEMVIQTSPGDGGPIQIIQGLPPCHRDLPAPMTAQRFYGVPPRLPVPPRVPFVQPPASQIPAAQPRTAQPKLDGSSPKP